MPHWRQHIEKDYMGAWDLVDPKTGKPRDYTLKITRVESKLLKTRERPKGSKKCVITLAGAKKQLVANTTICETIEQIYGSDTDGWVDKLITLYRGEARNPKDPKGPPVPAIRVRPRVQGSAAESIPDVPVDEGMRATQNAAFDREPEQGA